MKKKIIIGIIAIVVVAAGAMAYMNQSNQPEEVEVATIVKADIYKYVEETGVVMSDNQRVISAAMSGELASVTVEVGDEVLKGDVVGSFDLDSAELNIKSMQSKLGGLQPLYAQAKRVSTNSESLYNEGAISYDEYQTAVTNEKQLASQINELSYAIKQLEEMKDYGVITSPIDGIVTEVFAKAGETVISGMSLIEVADIDNIFVEVELLIDDASLVSENAEARIINKDIGLESNVGNSVTKIYPKAHMKVSDLGIEQKRIKMEITMEDTSMLKLGYDVDVEILVESKQDILIMPENAYYELDGLQYALKIDGSTAVQTQIELGIKNTDHVEVKSGLEEGEMVIISPSEDLTDGKTISY